MRHLIDLAALGVVYVTGCFFCFVYVALSAKRRELADGLGANKALARLVAAMPIAAAAALFVAALWLTAQVWR